MKVKPTQEHSAHVKLPKFSTLINILFSSLSKTTKNRPAFFSQYIFKYINSYKCTLPFEIV